jgi:hypothetical protein
MPPAAPPAGVRRWERREGGGVRDGMMRAMRVHPRGPALHPQPHPHRARVAWRKAASSRRYNPSLFPLPASRSVDMTMGPHVILTNIRTW